MKVWELCVKNLADTLEYLIESVGIEIVCSRTKSSVSFSRSCSWSFLSSVLTAKGKGAIPMSLLLHSTTSDGILTSPVMIKYLLVCELR